MPKRKARTSNRPRTKISTDVELNVLVKSRRRCALCYAFQNSVDQVKGQIAHINHNRSDNRECNLAFLCIPHHDEYDSKTSQSKNITQAELVHWKSKLEEVMAFEGKSGVAGCKIVIDLPTIPSGTELDEIMTAIRRSSLMENQMTLKAVTKGSVILDVEMDSSDLAKLLRAFHHSNLQELRVVDVQPTIHFLAPSKVFSRYWGKLGLFTENETLCLESESQSQISLNVRQFRLKLTATRSLSDPSVWAIVNSIVEGDSVFYGEPLIIWGVSEFTDPLTELRKFLDRHGNQLVHDGHESSSLIIDRKLVLWDTAQGPRPLSNQFIDRLRKIIRSKDGEAFWYIRQENGNNYRVAYFYSLPYSTIDFMMALKLRCKWFE
jgi:hypothetical protein